MRLRGMRLGVVGILVSAVACSQGSTGTHRSTSTVSHSGPKIVATIHIASPGPETAGAGYVWYSGNDGSLWRIDPATNKPTGQGILCSLGGRVVGFDSVWAYTDNSNNCRPGSTSSWRVWRIDPSIGRVTAEIPITTNALYYVHRLTVGEGSVWVRAWTELGTGDSFQGLPGFLDRIDPSSNRVTGSLSLASKDDGAVAAGLGAVWVTIAPQNRSGTLLQIDPRTLRVTNRTQVGRYAADISIGFGSVWVSNIRDSTLMRVDAASGRVVATIPIRRGAGPLAIGQGAVWTSGDPKGVLSEIDPSTNRVKAELMIGRPAYAVAVAFGSVWVSAADDPIIWRIDPGR